MITRFLVTIVITPTLFIALARALELRAWDLVITLWRPVTSGLIMAAVVLAANSTVTFSGPFRLLLDISLGIVSFCGSLFVLWFATGRPEGPESSVWTALRTHKLRLAFSELVDRRK